MNKSKQTNGKRNKSKRPAALVPTLLGTLVLLIVSGLLLNVFVFGIASNTSERVEAAITETMTMVPTSPRHYANEDGQTIQLYTSSPSTVWFGTGQNTNNSYLGLIFTGPKPLPAQAQIISAYIDVTPKNDAWLNLTSSFYAETALNPSPFSQESKPSQRQKTSVSKSVSDNVKWIANTHYKYDITSVLKALPNSSDRPSIGILAKGGSTQWGRKYVLGGIATDTSPRLIVTYRVNTSTTVAPTQPSSVSPTNSPSTPPNVTSSPTPIAQLPTNTVGTRPTVPHTAMSGESMAMMGWGPNGKNKPNPSYDKCDDGTNVVTAHNAYHVIAYDGLKYPTWHPPVVTNPITGSGKCYFGHEHGTNPEGYMYWNEMVQHFGKDINGDGVITKMSVSSTGVITPGDRAGIPFGIANEHMEAYYNQEGRDSVFVRHEDHVGHKIEFVNNESDMNGNSTHVMTQLANTVGVNIPYYTGSDSNNYKHTGVVCTHLHKFHQGTHSGDAILNNLHEVIFHSSCMSVNVNGINAASVYPNNTVLLTGMMAFGRPGEYKRFCYADRSQTVCPLGKNANGSCILNDPLLSKLPDAINSTSLGRNMVDRSCLENWKTINPGNNYFGPYELWEGDLQIQKANGDMLAQHGRQWDVLDPIRFVDPKSSTGFSYNASNCARGGAFDQIQYVGGCESRDTNVPWDSPRSGFRGLKRTTYFGRNRVSNPGGSQIWWTDPLGGNAVTTAFTSGLKQKISSVEADICKLSVCSTLNDRALQRSFNDGNGTVHAPN